ncbi:uncharacterized protein DFL_001436 [Arthrobotrys flagrans]|uniref:Uncharacterized protein n=1 Tax=Arthrobotrys flagrans TaxID=97331 RepID=A0A437A7M8_ARTFL|nr:hypothetical protein DFL_001436 [Arthrobotrys flagrans]
MEVRTPPDTASTAVDLLKLARWLRRYSYDNRPAIPLEEQLQRLYRTFVNASSPGHDLPLPPLPFDIRPYILPGRRQVESSPEADESSNPAPEPTPREEEPRKSPELTKSPEIVQASLELL